MPVPTTVPTATTDAEQTLIFARRQLIRAMRLMDRPLTRKSHERTALAVAAIDAAIEELES